MDRVVFIAAADEALDRMQGVGWVGHSLALGRRPYQRLTILEPHDAGRGASAFCVL